VFGDDSVDLRLGTHFLLPQIPPQPFVDPNTRRCRAVISAITYAVRVLLCPSGSPNSPWCHTRIHKTAFRCVRANSNEVINSANVYGNRDRSFSGINAQRQPNKKFLFSLPGFLVAVPAARRGPALDVRRSGIGIPRRRENMILRFRSH
jgi:hypothetical protein